MAMNVALQQVPWFAGLSAETITQLAQGARKRTFRRGEIVFHKGDPGQSLFLIVHGQVRIVLPSPAGEEVILGVLDAGDCFGEMALIDGQPRSATVVAIEPTETLMVRREDFMQIVMAQPRIAIDLLQLLARRLRDTDELVEDAVFLDVPGRLAKKLLELADAYGEPGPDGTVIQMRLSQTALAAMVGATRESVNKHLRWYRSRGILSVDHQRITIQRPEELRRRAY